MEIAISMLGGQCLDRRIGEREILDPEIESRQQPSEALGARIKWKTHRRKGVQQLARPYPSIARKSKSL
jgi:hypothetical protein